MFFFVRLYCLFLAALWSSAGEMVDLLTFLCVRLTCFPVLFSLGAPVQLCYLIVSIPELCFAFFTVLKIFFIVLSTWHVV